uniref:Uncharacterized protein n=1 Tax=Magallana gigas TaxID=29159 RepID=K1QCK1_MAGGI
MKSCVMPPEIMRKVKPNQTEGLAYPDNQLTICKCSGYGQSQNWIQVYGISQFSRNKEVEPFHLPVINIRNSPEQTE